MPVTLSESLGTGIIMAVLIAVIVVFRASPEGFEHSKIKLFLDILTGVSVFLVVLQIILSAIEAQEGDAFNRAQQMVAGNLRWLSITKDLADLGKTSPDYVREAWDQNTVLTEACNGQDNEKCAKAAQKYYVSLAAFQRVENFMTLHEWDNKNDREWISTFMDWIGSKQMQQDWKFSRHNYSKGTQDLIELMIEYDRKYDPKTDADQDKVANLILADPRYKTIVH